MRKGQPLFRPMRLCTDCGKYHTPAPLCSQGSTPVEVVFVWIGIVAYLAFAFLLLTPLAVGYAHGIIALGMPDLNDAGVTLLVMSYGSAVLTAYGVYKAWPLIRRFI